MGGIRVCVCVWGGLQMEVGGAQSVYEPWTDAPPPQTGGEGPWLVSLWMLSPLESHVVIIVDYILSVSSCYQRKSSLLII